MVRDKAMSLHIEKYTLMSGCFSPFRSESIRKSAYLNFCLISSDNQWPR